MHPYLVPTLHMGPIVIGRLMKTIPAAEHDRPLVEGRFTPREVVAHMADWEPIMLARVRQGVEQPESTCEAYDEAQMAIDHGYAQCDVFQELQKWQADRQKTIEYVSSLSREDTSKVLNHPERGAHTVEDWVGMLLGHDMYHVEQLSAYLEERVVPTW